MSKSSELALNKICRTCLSSSGDMVSLFETCSGTANKRYVDLLISFTPFNYNEHDGLPTHICGNCTSELHRFQTFQLKCSETRGILRNYHNKTISVKKEILNENCNNNNDASTYEQIWVKEEPLVTNKIEENRTHKLPYRSTRYVHPVITNKKRSFLCTICNKMFHQSAALSRHLKTHIGDKLYSCIVCDCSFNRKDYLTIHMRMHAGAKPYSCTICDCRFREKTALTHHLRTHT